MTQRPVQLTAENEAKLREIWSRLPKLECQGMCWDSCGSIEMTGLEHQLVERAGTPIQDSNYYRSGPSLCVALTEPFKQCGVYDDRPTICRIWGLVETLRCNYGCRPEGGHMTTQQMYLLYADVLELAGDKTGAEHLRFQWNDENAEHSKQLLLARGRQDEVDRTRRNARATANGTAMYATGRGQMSRTPPGGKPK